MSSVPNTAIDVPPITVTPTTTPPPENTHLFAGKYASAEELEKAALEDIKTLDLPIPTDKPLVGPTGVYKDHAALETAKKGFETLRGKLGTAKAAAATVVPVVKAPASLEIKVPEAGTLADDAGWEQVVKGAGLDVPALEAAWSESGSLTNEQYAALAKKGYPKGLVNQFVASQQAISAQRTEAALRAGADMAGGPEQLQTLMAWAGANMDKGWVEATNKRLKADPNTILDAVARISAEYAAKSGTGGSKPLVNGTRPATVGGGYTSIPEYRAALDKLGRGNATPEEIARIRATDDDKIYRS